MVTQSSQDLKNMYFFSFYVCTKVLSVQNIIFRFKKKLNSHWYVCFLCLFFMSVYVQRESEFCLWACARLSQNWIHSHTLADPYFNSTLDISVSESAVSNSCGWDVVFVTLLSVMGFTVMTEQPLKQLDTLLFPVSVIEMALQLHYFCMSEKNGLCVNVCTLKDSSSCYIPQTVQ